MEPRFPVFDIYSLPLLLLLLQGFLFVMLIGYRFLKSKQFSDFFLGTLLLLFCYERIHYTIGFMAWYDSFPNTKINYILFPMILAFGPMLYFYLRSVTVSKFKLKRYHLNHFVPFIIYIIYRFFLLIYDGAQPGFDTTQNGILMSKLEFPIINPLMIIIASFHFLIYLAFTIQHYWIYRSEIKQFYSNAYQLELNWIRNFLIIFGLLFLYDVLQNFIDSFIIDLHWTQKWWYHALSSTAIIYFGIKGYFTQTSKLQNLNFKLQQLPSSTKVQTTEEYNEDKLVIREFMDRERPYLSPTLNLKQLAEKLNISSAQLSEIVNQGFGLNFNDFINQYRVQAFKKAILAQKHLSHSLVGIAYDCGFNSKATFNRVFKKIEGVSPTEFINSK